VDGFRIANFIMQALYLPLHFAFIVRLLRGRLPTPIWRWFLVVVCGLWIMVSGRFLESVAYLFFPRNAFYVFAVDYQLVGTTFATSAYLIWNLYLAGHARLAESRLFKGALLALSGAVSLLVSTNERHHLFYEKLVMGEPVVHGRLFLACLLIVYGMLTAGYVVSVVHIVRHETERLRRLVVFSLYPVLPALAALIRSLSGVDRLDYTPIIMTVSVLCLYLMVFRLRYVHLVPQSIEAALDQTRTAIAVLGGSGLLYANRAMQTEYAPLLDALQPRLGADGAFETRCGERDVRVTVSAIGADGARLVTVTDLTALLRQQSLLAGQIEEQNRMIASLEEKRRNIDAYLDALYQIPDLKEKKETLTAVQKEIADAFGEIEANLRRAANDVSGARAPLEDTIRLTRETIASVRAAVAHLKEEGS